MKQEIKWGIIGSGQIARRFASDLLRTPGAELIGVTGRDPVHSSAFADRFKTDVFSSTEELLRSDVDVIYVATPHSSHKPLTLLALKAGKAVLCEKPFGLSREEAEEMVFTAKTENLFLMEAMWTRFNPVMKKVCALVKSGAIGEIKKIDANFGYAFPFNPSSRVYDLKLGGGSLLDVGVYCISFFQMLMESKPSEIHSKIRIGVSGVDEDAVWTETYENGCIATGHSSVTQVTNHEASIVGTKGSITLPKFWCPREYSIRDRSELLRTEKFNFDGEGFQFEAEEVMNCLRRRKLESDTMPLDESLKVMETLERIKKSHIQLSL